MSYASRFFQSVGATSVHASPERLTSIANAVNGRKALRHAFESARYGERNAAGGVYSRKLARKITVNGGRNLSDVLNQIGENELYPYQRESVEALKKHIVGLPIGARKANVVGTAHGVSATEGAVFATVQLDKSNPAVGELINTLSNAQAAPNVRVGGQYEPRRKNQHSKPCTVLAVENGYVAFRRGDAGKMETISIAEFLEKVKL